MRRLGGCSWQLRLQGRVHVDGKPWSEIPKPTGFIFYQVSRPEIGSITVELLDIGSFFPNALRRVLLQQDTRGAKCTCAATSTTVYAQQDARAHMQSEMHSKRRLSTKRAPTEQETRERAQSKFHERTRTGERMQQIATENSRSKS